MTRARVFRGPELLDWWQIVTDLARVGCSHEEAARWCGRSRGWVTKLRNVDGTRPKFEDGILLLALWSLKTGRAVTEAPVVRSRT